MNKANIKGVLNGLIAIVDNLNSEENATTDHVTLRAEDYEAFIMTYNEMESVFRNLIHDATEVIEEYARWAYRDGLDHEIEQLALGIDRSVALLDQLHENINIGLAKNKLKSKSL